MMHARQRFVVIFVIFFALTAVLAYWSDVYIQTLPVQSFSVKETGQLNLAVTQQSKISAQTYENKIFNNINVNLSVVVENCAIFNSNKKNFEIIIDGVKYPKRVPLHHNKSLDFDCMKKVNTKPKLILFWTTYFADPTWWYGLGKSEPFRKNQCPIDNCELTADKKRLHESDFVAFHMYEWVNSKYEIDKIPRLNKKQRWIFVTYESPMQLNYHQNGIMKTKVDFTRYQNIFNLSATYRQESDFSSYYYEPDFIFDLNQDFDADQDFSSGKTHLAFWVVSSKHKMNERAEYVRQMQTLVAVDIFGSGGDGLDCPNVFENGTSADCKLILSQKYKFYLSFENSICDDYITEKFFTILKYDIVPVVYGAGPYDAHIPKSAYVNVLDFSSPNELANYLLYLDSNKTAYNEYFAWKRYVKYTRNKPYFHPICEMCIKLNIDEQYGIKSSVFNSNWSVEADCKHVVKQSPMYLLNKLSLWHF